MPAVEAFLRQEVEDGEERAARSRRAAKALTYGSYNLKELIQQFPIWDGFAENLFDQRWSERD